MSCENAKAVESAFDTGRWSQARHEAERCLAIYSSGIARARPFSAWATLPLGLDVEGSLELIGTAEPEDDPGSAEWTKHIGMLRGRVSRVEMQTKLWNKKYGTAN